ncbi:MAG TPA: NUDIX domain-containing protein, partial [Rectinemataceae bacterium]
RWGIEVMDIAAELARADSLFRWCPACSGPNIRGMGGRGWTCPDCGFELYSNVAAAAGLILELGGEIVLLRRAKDPRKGFLAFPGGFVDPGESAWDCLARECDEELGWKPEKADFVGSYPNLYVYKGVPYATCDLFFSASAGREVAALFDFDPAEVDGIVLAPLESLPWEEIAFGSAVSALKDYRARKNAGPWAEGSDPRHDS